MRLSFGEEISQFQDVPSFKTSWKSLFSFDLLEEKRFEKQKNL